jgi:putative ABC transport system permease protein
MVLFRLKRVLRLGIKSLWLHKLRSVLTVLGIVFGVCSVIAMLAIGEGASHEAQEQIKELGSQNIIIKSVKPPQDESASAQQRSFAIDYGLTYEDAERMNYTIPSVQVIVPMRSIRRDIWYHTLRVDGQVIGTVPWYPDISNSKLQAGRFINAVEMKSAENVCVLGAATADKIFSYENPLGKVIKVGGDYYRVVGVMQEKSTANPGGKASTTSINQLNYQVFIPLTAARSRFGDTLIRRTQGTIEAERVELHEIIVKVEKLDQVMETAAILQEMLSRFHQKQDYELVVPLELLRQAEHTKRIFNIVLGSIAAISLLVGGIGIMNIMLASVTERTREIGIRRALGAKRRDIITQFLTETVMLSGSGGMIGLFIGVTIPFFITRFAHMATIVTLWSLLLAFCISAAVGVVFGLYPAYRAANMDPIEALRHE